MSDGVARTPSGVGLALVAVASVQLGAALAVLLFPLTGPGGAVWLRLLVSALLLALVVPWTRLPARPRWSASAWTAVAAFGLCMAGMNWSFYSAIDRIPLGVAVALEFTGPLTLALVLSRRASHVVWVVAAAAGIAGLTLDPTSLGRVALDPVGAALAVTAGAFWAGYILLAGRVGRLVPGSQGLSAALVVGAVALAPVGLSAGSRLLDPRVLVLAVGVAVLSTALAYALELEALRRIPARLFGTLMSIGPAVAALAGLVFLGQRLTAAQWIGVLAVCGASLGAAATARRAPLAT